MTKSLKPNSYTFGDSPSLRTRIPRHCEGCKPEAIRKNNIVIAIRAAARQSGETVPKLGLYLPTEIGIEFISCED